MWWTGAVATEGIDIVVTNYRTPGDLQAFLESLDAYPPSCPWELWVCNVQPKDRDHCLGVNWARKTDGHHVTYYENAGYGRSCNHAASRGSREVVVFFNADVVLTENALDECYQALLSHEDWGVLGPRQVNEHGLLTHVGIFGSNQQPHFGEDGKGWKEVATDTNFMGVNDAAISVAGSAYFMRREAWSEITSLPGYQEWLIENNLPRPWGALLPTPLYFEDMFASLVARSQGWKVVYLGTTTIIHRWHKAIEAAGEEPTEKYVAAREMFRSVLDRLGIEHE